MQSFIDNVDEEMVLSLAMLDDAGDEASSPLRFFDGGLGAWG
jgi:hypothetical protein